MAKTKQTHRLRKLLATEAAEAAVAAAKSNNNNKTKRNITASATGGKRKKKTSSPVGEEEKEEAELESWTCHACDFAQRPTRRTMEENAQCSRCSCVRGDILHTERSAGVEHLLRNHPLQTSIPFRCVWGEENIIKKN